MPSVVAFDVHTVVPQSFEDVNWSDLPSDPGTVALLAKISGLAQKFAMRRRLDKADAHDVAQEVVLESVIRMRKGTWNPAGKSLEIVVKRMVKQKIVAHLRQEHRRSRREERYMVIAGKHVPLWMRTEDLVLGDEFTKAYHEALTGLAPLAREILILRGEEDLTLAETAERLNISKATVRQSLRRTRRQLKRFLAEYAGEAA